MNGTRVVSLVAVLVMASMASGATVWNPAANGIVPPDVGNWNDPLNWTNDVPGVFDVKAVFNVTDAAECQVTDAQSTGETGQWVQGDNGPGGVLRVMDGGSLSQPGGEWAAVGYNNSAHMIVEDGGVVDFFNHMWVAFVVETGFFEEDRPIVDINGGTITVGGMFGIGWQVDDFGFLDRGIGYVNVNEGGLLALSNIHSDGVSSISPGSLLNISGTGVVTLPGDFVNTVSLYIDAGGIVANDGVDPVDVSFDVDADLTTLKVLVPSAFEADFDGDGDVDGDDFLAWQGGFGTPSGAEKMDGDYDNDGDVDGDDFLGWQDEFGSTDDGAGSAAVPEPAALVLVFLGLVAICRIRGRA